MNNSPDLTALKQEIKWAVDAQRQALFDISARIHDHPEIGFQETNAAAWLTDYLEDNGFSVQRGVCDLPTAFRAAYGTGKPAIALMAEYDALPDLGHACGHNIIAASAIGAGVAARPAVDRFGGSVLVIGTPAEELHGGKVLMAERGAFSDIDVAMMVHPGVCDVATNQALACQTLDVEFFGRAAHAAAYPENGINALDAMMLAFNSINALRQHIKDKARIHGIITAGGEAANIVPAYSAGDFIVRAEEDSYLDELKERVLNCFIGAATATGARLEHRWGETRYAPLLNNQTLAGLFSRNMGSLGRDVLPEDPTCAFGSTDMGNVSQLVPAIHPTVAIAPAEVVIHSPQFAEVAASEAGQRGIIDAATALAMTALDLLADSETIARVKKEFAGR